MTTPQCEFCGKFGATKGRWNDPRGNPYPHEKGIPYELCSKCWDIQNAWGIELQREVDHNNYMVGWDWAITHPCTDQETVNQHSNLYWRNGFNDCLDEKPLPEWYDEWRRKGKN